MQLPTAFIALPIRLDASAMRDEILALPDSAWRPHPQGFAGNWAVALVASNGDHGSDALVGPMAPTSWLRHLPATNLALSRLGCPVGRTRLMRIDGNAEARLHTDLDSYWRTRHRVHMPIVTTPGVQFHCGDESRHMAAGEAWIFDTTRLHRVVNPQPSRRIHLVVDTVGNEQLTMLARGQPIAQQDWPTALELVFESTQRPGVLPPADIHAAAAALIDLFAAGPLDAAWSEGFKRLAMSHAANWQTIWHGTGRAGDAVAPFRAEQERFKQALDSLGTSPDFRTTPATEWVSRWLLDPSISAERPASGRAPSAGSSLTMANPSHASQPANQQATVEPESRYSSSLPALLSFLGGSLLVSTYANNQVVVLRADGENLNTHFKHFPVPMGIAAEASRLALGSGTSVWTFRNQPECTSSLAPRPDAAYVPTQQHFTGDIRVHELAWGKDALWLVNTRFSCIATLDAGNSFVPRWKPWFISDMTQNDACHLNGLAMHRGEPRWVTAMGQTGQTSGWRERKADGGIIIDIVNNAVVTSGLCMPHSPRWHGNCLWVLDSGHGRLCTVSPSSGVRTDVATVPGFARGLALVGRYAFIGVSQVRAKAWFDDLPITRNDHTRECGVWAVDTESGETIAWLTFDAGVEEIFDVQWLPGLSWPDILEPDDPLAINAFQLPASS